MEIKSDISNNEIMKEEKIKRNRKRPSTAERYSEERKKAVAAVAVISF